MSVGFVRTFLQVLLKYLNSSGGYWGIYMGVHLIRENLTKAVVSNQDYENLSFHELVK